MLKRILFLLLLAATAHAQAPEPPAILPWSAGGLFAGPVVLPSPGLFESGENQVLFSMRGTHVSGDAARFQRFQDRRTGPLLSGARLARTFGSRSVWAGADNVGYRDQQYFASVAQAGAWAVSAFWNEIPQFYSRDTRTPFTADGAVLTLDNGIQQAIQAGQATLSAYVPVARSFDLRESRKVGVVSVKATPSPTLDLTASFQSTKHSGELPWGASFGLANDVEVALPYSSRTNDVNLGAEWSNGQRMLSVAYTSSWFDNENTPLVWDNPLRLDDSATAPGRGQMALWPTHTAHTVSAAGYVKFPGRSQVTAFVSHSLWSNDTALLPFTINAALPQLPLPRPTSDASVQVTSANLNVVSRPSRQWRLGARLRLYDFTNDTAPLALPQMVSYDTSVRATPTGGPELFARSRVTGSADATWTGTPVALTIGVQREHGRFDHRIFETTTEDTVTVRADAVSTGWSTVRLAYEHADREGDGLDEAGLSAIGEQPLLRHYDLANRRRHRFTALADFSPLERITFNVNAAAGHDDYPDSYFGLTAARFTTAGAGVDVVVGRGVNVGGSYTFERYTGDQRSRSAAPGVQQTDPARDWTADSRERVHYFSLYATPPPIAGRTELRASYDWSDARTRFAYGVVPNGPLPAPAQLPEVFNRLQQLRVEARHRLGRRLSATAQYLFEPFDVFDFAFDPSVVDGIVQPSTLVMGYVYRPYRAHSATAGLLYSW